MARLVFLTLTALMMVATRVPANDCRAYAETTAQEKCRGRSASECRKIRKELEARCGQSAERAPSSEREDDDQS